MAVIDVIERVFKAPSRNKSNVTEKDHKDDFDDKDDFAIGHLAPD